jgi:hypothetical protein
MRFGQTPASEAKTRMRFDYSCQSRSLLAACNTTLKARWYPSQIVTDYLNIANSLKRQFVSGIVIGPFYPTTTR